MIDWNYELAERETLFSLAKDGDTFFDIGANEGVYSITFAKRFPNSKVYAFEPILETATKLTKNITDSKAEVIVCYYGLSDENDIATFYYSSSDPGATSLAPLEERFGPTMEVHRRVSTIDKECAFEENLHPNIIKCDVEGAELLVFKGAEKTLARHHPIIQCEMLRKWAKRFNYHPNDIIAFLAKFGYQCFALRNGRLEKFDVMTEETVETNFYFIAEGGNIEL